MKRIALDLLIVMAAVAAETPQELFQKALVKERSEGKLEEAIQFYRRAADSAGKDRALAAKALVQLGECYEKMGSTEARKQYDRVIRDYADQKESVATARARLGGNAAHETGIVQKQVWSWTGGEGVDPGRPSPDGRYLAWVNWKSRAGSLALRDLATGESRDLTHTPWIPNKSGGFAESPLFTPDGKQILYMWYQDDTAANGTWEWQLRFINSDGSNERIFHMDAYPGAVSPDGKLAAVLVSQKPVSQLGLLNLASGKVTVLKSFTNWGRAQIGNFSPDGRYLVYSLLGSQESQDRDVYAIAVDGSQESKLVSAPGANRGPFFTPDGSNVVFTSNRSSRWDLWSVRVVAGKAEGSPEVLKPDVGQVENMGFARDGTFYFGQYISQGDAYMVELDPATGKIKGAPKPVSDRFVHTTGAPRWSPDGKLLAYVSNRTLASGSGAPSEMTFVVRETASSKEREFTVPFRSAGSARFYRWFPDSKSLLLATNNAATRLFRKLDLTTGEIRPLFEIPLHNDRILDTAISPDGRSLFYSVNDASSSTASHSMAHLIRRDLATGEEKDLFQIRTTGQGLNSLCGSPDGKYVAFFAPGKGSTGESVWVAPTSGGEPRELLRDKQRSGVVWDIQGRGLFLAQNSAGAKGQEIWYFPIDGGEPHSTGLVVQGLGAFSIHPDGHLFGFGAGTGSGQVWSLKNLFPKTFAAR